MGSPGSEARRNTNEHLHRRKIGRRFAISSEEVTKAQWRVFVESQTGYAWPADNVNMETVIRTEDSPITGMMWFEAAHYCNWLSGQEGIPQDQWCYEPNDKGQYVPGMKAKENFWELTGYRLPTEAEWEFACRAGANTSRCFGRTEKLLSRYAWSFDNSDGHVWPVASLKPNDSGLFDMHGNASEWVYDAITSYPSDFKVDAPNTMGVSSAVFLRVTRGGGFTSAPAWVRTARRTPSAAGDRLAHIGFRPARTYRSSP